MEDSPEFVDVQRFPAAVIFHDAAHGDPAVPLRQTHGRAVAPQLKYQPGGGKEIAAFQPVEGPVGAE